MGGTEDGLKVGELARAAGLSIRTVRYYDQIGLLTPSRRSSAGHRVYDDIDVRRLHHICLLRRTGLPLAEIGKALDEPGWDLRDAMLAHLELIDHQQAVGAALRRRLAAMVNTTGTGDTPSTDQLLETMEEMTMLDEIVQRRISVAGDQQLAVEPDPDTEVTGAVPGGGEQRDRTVGREVQTGREVLAGSGREVDRGDRTRWRERRLVDHRDEAEELPSARLSHSSRLINNSDPGS